VVAACGFYWLREQCRIAYAIIEIVLGCCALYSAAPVTEGGSFSQAFDQFSFGGITKIQYITIVGAVYFIIRGLDNLDKGLQGVAAWNALRSGLGINRR
jgi:hypothetical protein